MTSMAAHLEGEHFRSGNMTIDEPAVALPIWTGLWSRMLSRPELTAPLSRSTNCQSWLS